MYTIGEFSKLSRKELEKLFYDEKIPVPKGLSDYEFMDLAKNRLHKIHFVYDDIDTNTKQKKKNKG